MSVFFTRRGKAAQRGPELLDNFADNPWENIIWACQTGNVPDTWTVASQKPMTINGASYAIDIIGLGHDDYADGSGKAPLTLQMHDIYGTTYATNSSMTNVGGWKNCLMRTTHLPAIKALMPAEVQTGIKAVSKKTTAGNKSTSIDTTSDELFLLSEIELQGGLTYTASGEGSQYAYYAAGNSKIKKQNGSDLAWRLRSPAVTNTTSFCAGAYRTGKPSAFSADSPTGVAFAFCF